MARYGTTRPPQNNVVTRATKRFEAALPNPQLVASSARQLTGLTPAQQTRLRENALTEVQIQTRDRLNQAMQRYADGKIAGDAFKTIAQGLIRKAVVAAAVIVRGGAQNVTDAVLTSIQRTISTQFEKLDTFVEELATRKVTQRDRARFLNNSSTVRDIASIATRQQSLPAQSSEEAFALGDSGYCPDCVTQIGTTIGNWYDDV